jgi:hypothetical protein
MQTAAPDGRLSLEYPVAIGGFSSWLHRNGFARDQFPLLVDPADVRFHYHVPRVKLA